MTDIEKFSFSSPELIMVALYNNETSTPSRHMNQSKKVSVLLGMDLYTIVCRIRLPLVPISSHMCSLQHLVKHDCAKQTKTRTPLDFQITFLWDLNHRYKIAADEAATSSVILE